jgi:hypothetical protein
MTNVRTYAQDIIARSTYSSEGFQFGEGHMVLTLGDMVRTTFYEREGGKVAHIDIDWHRLDRQGYTSTGEYFGSGARVYAVDCDTGEHVRTFWVRAPNRRALRTALRRLYPLAKISL